MVKVKSAEVRSCLDDPWAATAAAYSDTSADDIRNTVRGILEDVNVRGDEAVTEYAVKFDKSTRTSHKLSQAEIDAAIAEMIKDDKGMFFLDGITYRGQMNVSKPIRDVITKETRVMCVETPVYMH